ncbi:hypothetical protein LJK87_13590 [Paenibacillus sp. P25]|nr:hypothetical protein LJK87_13590 [Paenibacillus sp. P25]
MPNITLGEFLRARRERLTPEEVGLSSFGRRRTPGRGVKRWLSWRISVCLGIPRWSKAGK